MEIIFFKWCLCVCIVMHLNVTLVAFARVTWFLDCVLTSIMLSSDPLWLLREDHIIKAIYKWKTNRNEQRYSTDVVCRCWCLCWQTLKTNSFSTPWGIIIIIIIWYFVKSGRNYLNKQNAIPHHCKRQL